MSNKPENITIDEAAFAAVEADAAAVDSVERFTYKFPEGAPFAWEGKTYTELTFDYSKCKGRDILEVSNELKALGRPVVVRALDSDFCVRLAARMCNPRLGVDVLLEMPGKAFDAIEGSARRFLLRSE